MREAAQDAAQNQQRRRKSGAKRRRILHDIADAITERAQEIAVIESADTGQPIRYMARAAVRGAENSVFSPIARPPPAMACRFRTPITSITPCASRSARWA